MTKYATGFPSAGALTGAETLQVVRAGADLQAAVSDIVAANPPSQNNLLINADGQINQTGFAGGALASGVYGYDMHKAGTGGCNVSVASTGVWTHTSGQLVQVLELPQLASQVVTASVYDPTGNVTITIDGVSGTITAGSGQRSVSINVPSGSTGNVTYTRTATGVTYSRPKLERGSIATPWNPRPVQVENAICRRYYQIGPSVSASVYFIGMVTASTLYAAQKTFPVEMRSSPTMSITVAASAAMNVGSQAIIDSDKYGFRVSMTASSTNAQGVFAITWIADARL